MKIALHHILLLTILGSFAVAGNAVAQDAGMSDVDIVGDRGGIDSEKMLYSPGEAEVRYIPKASGHTIKDSVAIYVAETPVQERKLEPVRKANENLPAKTKDDSILSFNFLYYIIQKYKLQDIID
jgi:hypothetical protein